jgi:hypothetical protein
LVSAPVRPGRPRPAAQARRRGARCSAARTPCDVPHAIVFPGRAGTRSRDPRSSHRCDSKLQRDLPIVSTAQSRLDTRCRFVSVEVRLKPDRHCGRSRRGSW